MHCTYQTNLFWRQVEKLLRKLQSVDSSRKSAVADQLDSTVLSIDLSKVAIITPCYNGIAISSIQGQGRAQSPRQCTHPMPRAAAVTRMLDMLSVREISVRGLLDRMYGHGILSVVLYLFNNGVSQPCVPPFLNGYTTHGSAETENWRPTKPNAASKPILSAILEATSHN